MMTLFFTLLPISVLLTFGAYLAQYWCFVEEKRRQSTSILWAPWASYVVTFATFLIVGPRLGAYPSLQREFLIGISYAQLLPVAVCLLVLFGFRRTLPVGYKPRLVSLTLQRS